MRTCYGRGRPLRFAIYAACLSAFVFFGYDQGVLSGLLENEYFQEQFGSPVRQNESMLGCQSRLANNQISLPQSQESSCQAIVSTLISTIYHIDCFSDDFILTGLGALIGCVINFAIGDWLGRRKMIWMAMGLIIIGAVLQTSAYSVPHLIVGRIITGFGTGIDSSTVPMYQSELCRKEWRGRIVSWEIWFIGELGFVLCDYRHDTDIKFEGAGIVIAYWTDYGFSYVQSHAAWRTPIALQLIFAIAVTVIVWGLPESPRWLYKRGRKEETLEVLCAVHDLPPDDEYIIDEMQSIQMAVQLEQQEGTQSTFAVFKKDILQTRKRVMLAWFGLFMNQLSGINLV